MIMKKICYMIVIAVPFFIVGCGSDEPKPNEDKKIKISGFQTKQSTFIKTIDNVASTKKERNDFIDEFILKSNLQCQYYLANPVSKSSKNNQKKQLYISIFDAVSQVFGMKQVTDAAKELYAGDDNSNKTKNAYENALTPEIIRGVNIARKQYAQRMILGKNRLIESYTISMLKQDVRNYDKLCNHETGLIEINKALRKAQKQPKIKPFTPTMKIDPKVIKEKVVAVTKKAETEENLLQDNLNVSKETEFMNSSF